MFATAKSIPTIHPGCSQLYAFDILSMLIYNMNDPEKYAQLMNTMYKDIDAEFHIVKANEFGVSNFMVEFQKREDLSHADTDVLFRSIIGKSILSVFSEDLTKIPGLGIMNCGEVKELITRSIIILDLTNLNSDTCVYQISFSL